MNAGRPVIQSKLVPPSPAVGLVGRPRLLSMFGSGRRVMTVVAPPGYGKTEAVRQWQAVSAVPVAWLAIDLLDDDPVALWRNFLAAVRLVSPAIDDEPELLLGERGCADLMFLAVLIAQIERADATAAVVLDDLTRITDRRVLDGITLLVDRIGHLLQIVLVSRSDLAVPTARWRSAGWLCEIREEDLRLSDDEAWAIAQTFPDVDIGTDAVIALNRRVEGWPAGLHLALLSLAGAADADLAAKLVVGSDRLLADYLVTEVLDLLPSGQRDVALDLSVLDWFDAELCASLLGSHAVPLARDLHRRRLFVTKLAGPSGAMRFHPLFRELLESELEWRDPPRRAKLHRDAAAIWKARGDLNAAYRHLVRIGDHRQACELVVPMALDFVDRGDFSGLRQRLGSLPASLQVDEPSAALDLAIAWQLAGSESAAVRWCDRAEAMMVPARPADQVRLHATRCVSSLMSGDLSAAHGHVAGYERLVGSLTKGNPIDDRFATIGARVALGSGDLEAAALWVDRAAAIVDPDPVVFVIAPALRAWLKLECGDVRTARALADGAWASATRLGMRPHHGTFEALLVAGRCRLAAGELSDAAEFGERARTDADTLLWPYNRARVGVLLAEVRRLAHGPRASLAMVDELQASFVAEGSGHLVGCFAVVEALSLIGCGRYEAASRIVDGLDDRPAKRLLRARLALASRSGAQLEVLLADRRSWAQHEQLEADVLLATAGGADPGAEERWTAVLLAGHASGWVSPFLGHGERTNQLLHRLAIDRLHPRLAEALAPTLRPVGSGGRHLVEQLTPREHTVLELLPTHLSYAQIGDRLYLSVNTIKTNVKSLYRKLQVSSRAEAVEVAADLHRL